MTLQSLSIPDTDPLIREQSSLITTARSVVEILDVESYEVAALCKRKLAERRMIIFNFFKPIKQSIDVAKKTVLDRERLVATPVLEEEDRIGRLMVVYTDEQERKRKLAERQSQDDAQIVEAEQYEMLGDKEAAEAALNGQGLVQVKQPSSVPKVAGISYRENWHCEVVNLKALVQSVAEGKAPLAYLQANVSALNSAARSLKTELNAIPGVKAVLTKTAIGRR